MIVCNKCFINSCNCKDNDYVEIDDKILDTIKLLNSKGYITEHCCSGHYGSEQLYVIFNRLYAFNEDKLPEGFYVDNKNTYRIYPRTSIHSKQFWTLDKETTKDDDSINSYIDKINKDLYNWALSLPDIIKEEDLSKERFDTYKVIIAKKHKNEDKEKETVLNEDTAKRFEVYLKEAFEKGNLIIEEC